MSKIIYLIYVALSLAENASCVSESTTSNPVTSTTSEWIVSGTNGTCVSLRGNLTFALTYPNAEGLIEVGRIPIPETAKVSGMCNSYIAMLNLAWQAPGASVKQTNNITFLFTKAGFGEDIASWSLTAIFGKIYCIYVADPITFPNAAETPIDSFQISAQLTQSEITAALAKPYVCESYKSYTVNKLGSVQLEMSRVKLEAFHERAANEFAETSICAEDTTLKMSLSPTSSILTYTLIPIVIVSVLCAFIWRNLKRTTYSEV